VLLPLLLLLLVLVLVLVLLLLLLLRLALRLGLERLGGLRWRCCNGRGRLGWRCELRSGLRRGSACRRRPCRLQ
jgi:hypothetical protein